MSASLGTPESWEAWKAARGGELADPWHGSSEDFIEKLGIIADSRGGIESLIRQGLSS